MKVELWLSLDDDVNIRAFELLERTPGVEPVVAPDGRILEGKVILPFIQFPDGERFFGLDSIERGLKARQ